MPQPTPRALAALVAVLVAAARRTAADACQCSGSPGDKARGGSPALSSWAEGTRGGSDYIDARRFPLHNATAQWDIPVRRPRRRPSGAAVLAGPCAARRWVPCRLRACRYPP
jgi:hypothetical protein